MPTRRQIPPTVLDAAQADLHERTVAPWRECRDLAEHAIDAALTAALPGLYVYREPSTGAGGELAVICAQNPEQPGFPTDLLVRTQANAPLFDMIAALLPDRTQEG